MLINFIQSVHYNFTKQQKQLYLAMHQAELLNATQPMIQTVSNFRTIKSRKLPTPLKQSHRGSALTHRLLCDESTERQIKLSEKFLPKLQLRSLSKSRKQSSDIQKSHLEQWINNQLEDDDIQGQGQLKAIRKYEIDKKSLLNMQITSEEIDKLYQTLYVYSHGVKNAFLQLIGKNNEELMIRFWRVYILLLEDKNVSTLVERRHQQSLDIVMRTLKATQRQVQNLRKETVEKEKKLSKQIVSKQDQIQKIKGQKDIIESNLILTDEAFNQEVSKRLIFQQKINQINTIHNQLKLKHKRLVQQLQMRQKIDFESKQSRKQFQNQKKNYEIKITYLQKQVSQLKEKLKQSQEQMTQNKNQIHDLKQQQLKMARDDQKQYLQFKDVIIRQKKYKLQLQNEIDAKMKIESLLIEKTNQINRLAAITDTDRQRIQADRKRRVQLEQIVNSLSKKVQEKEKTLRDTLVYNESLVSIQRADKRSIKQLTQNIENEKNLTVFQQRTITTLEGNIKTLDKLIQQLKGTKHKHQTISQALTLQNAKLLQTVRQLKNQEYVLQQRNRQLTIKLVEKESLQNSKQMNMKNEVDINKQKIKSLTIQLNNKEKINVEISEKLSKLRESVIQKQYKLQQLRQSFAEQQRNLNLQLIEKKSLQSRLGVKEEQVSRTKEQLKQICAQLLDIKNQDIELTKTNNELMFIQQNNQKSKNIELETLKRVIVNYRKQIKAVNTNIHPMDYWSKEGEVLRLVEKYEIIRNKIQQKDKLIEKLQESIKQINNRNRAQIEKASAGYALKLEDIRSNLEQKTKKLNEISQFYSNIQNINKQLEQKLQVITKEKDSIQDKYSKISSKQYKNHSCQTHQKTFVDQIIQTQIQQVKRQKSNQTIIQKVDKETDTFGLVQYFQINKVDSPFKSTSFNIREEDQMSELSIQKVIEDVYSEQLLKHSETVRKLNQAQAKLKPVSKQDFTRAMKIAFLRN